MQNLFIISKYLQEKIFQVTDCKCFLQEIAGIIMLKFERLKEEVNADLVSYAGDLVTIMKKDGGVHPEWKETLEDLLVVAQRCAMMTPCEFWSKCEGIVQNLDDRRQDMPMGTLKKVHTRILFILTRCTRMLQFQKEGGFAMNENIFRLHQLSDLGFYPEQGLKRANQGVKTSMSGKDVEEKLTRKSQEQGQGGATLNQDGVHNLSSNTTHLSESETAIRIDSSSSRERISSWRKLPSVAEKNQMKAHDAKEAASKKKLDNLDMDSHEIRIKPNIPECRVENSAHPADPSLNGKRVSWSYCIDQQHVYGDSIICRICDVEIPTVHVEDHSRICTIADRCDLKGLTVNERLERVAETLEKIMESCSPKSLDNAEVGGLEVARVSTSSIPDYSDGLSPKQNNLSCQTSGGVIDCLSEGE